MLGAVPLCPFLVLLGYKIRVTQANAQEQAVHILLMVRFHQGCFFVLGCNVWALHVGSICLFGRANLQYVTYHNYIQHVYN